jgi:hypothetical protein
VIDNTGRHAKQLFHTRETARILFLAEELHEHVRVEFKDTKEFDAFMSLFISCNEAKFCKVFAKVSHSPPSLISEKAKVQCSRRTWTITSGKWGSLSLSDRKRADLLDRWS